MAVRNSSVSLVKPLYTQKEDQIQPMHVEQIRACGYDFPKRIAKTAHLSVQAIEESTGSEETVVFNSRAKSFRTSQADKVILLKPIVMNPQDAVPLVESRYKSRAVIEHEIRQSHVQKQPQPIQARASTIKPDRRTQMEQVYAKLYTQYTEHKIDLAYKTSLQLTTKYKTQLNQHQQFQQRQKFLDLVKKEYDDMVTYLSQFDKPGWNLKSKDKGVIIHTKDQDNNIAIKLESQLDVPIEKFVTILNEVDLHKKYVPFVVKSSTEKIISRNRKIGHVVSDLPFLSTRQAFFQGVGYDRLDTNGTIFVYSRSIHNRPDLQQLFGYTPKPKKDSVMLNYKCISIEYKPLSISHGLIRMYFNADMSIKFIPTFILESSSKKFCHDLFNNMVKISKKFEGSDWEKAVQKDPELFNFFKKVVGQYVATH